MNLKRSVLYLFVMLMFCGVNISLSYAADNGDVSGGTASFTVGSATYRVNGADKTMDTVPYINKDRTYVPVRFLGYAMGLTDADIAYDPAKQKVTLTKGTRIVELTIGNNTIIVNGQAKTMDVAPEISNNRTMLPARFVVEGMGFQVGWDKVTSTVSIFSNGVPPQNVALPTANDTAPARATDLSTSINLVAYLPGEGHQVSLYTKNTDGSKVDVTEKAEWQSGNTDIATVHKGFIVGQSTGKTVITAQYDGKKADITFDNTVHSLRTNTALVVYQIGEGHPVRAYAKYADGKEIDVTEPAECVKEPIDWESSNDDIATVNNGFIVCHSAGKAVITIKYGGQKAEVTFDNTVYSLRTDVGEVNYEPGEGHQVCAYAKYADGSEANITEPAEWQPEKAVWQSSNTSIATVGNGIIYAVSTGTAVITVQYGGKEAKIIVNSTIKVNVPPGDQI